MGREEGGYGKLGIIGGTSLLKSDLFSSTAPKTVSTIHGNVILHVEPAGSGGRPLVFLQRHLADADAGPSVYRPPHMINTRANIAALKAEGVDRVVAVCCVGSLGRPSDVGRLVVPDDYSMLFCGSVSFYDDDRGHMVPGIDAQLRQHILEAIKARGLDAVDGGTYVQTPGPRFETRAEVRFLRSMGDVVGMTAGSEATMAKEAGLRYAMLCMVDNMANGLGEAELTKEDFEATVKKNQATVETATSSILNRLLPTT